MLSTPARHSLGRCAATTSLPHHLQPPMVRRRRWAVAGPTSWRIAAEGDAARLEAEPTPRSSVDASKPSSVYGAAHDGAHAEPGEPSIIESQEDVPSPAAVSYSLDGTSAEATPPHHAGVAHVSPTTPASLTWHEKAKSGDAYKILRLAFPLMVQNVFGYLMSIICTIAIGRIGPQELAASSLSNSVYVVSGLSLTVGLSAAMETLCGQAYGAGEYYVLGEVLQRALLVCWAAAIPISFLWLNIPSIMVSLGQDATIAAMAGRYLLYCIPCLLLNIASDCLKRYLMAQSIVQPGMWATAAGSLMAPVFFYLIVHQMGAGLDGAAMAFCCCQITQVVCLLGYVYHHTRTNAGTSKATWMGFSWQAALSKWGTYLHYGIPAMMMISLDLWMYQVAVVMSGWLPNTAVALSVGGICTSLNAWVYMVPLGLGSAVNTLVGNTLGSGNGPEAQRAALTGLGIALLTVLTTVTGVATNAHRFIALVAVDPAVNALANHVVPVLCFLMFWDGLNAVLAGILRGSGEQATGAIVALVAFGVCVPLCYYLTSHCAPIVNAPQATGAIVALVAFGVCVPLCYYLTFTADPATLSLVPFVGGLQPVARVWLGIGMAGCLQTCTLLAYLSSFDWQKIADRARKVDEEQPGDVASDQDDGSSDGPVVLSPAPA